MSARRAAAVALNIFAVIMRLVGIALSAIVVVLCFSGAAARLDIVGLVVDLSRALPDIIAGYGVVATPFGGVFRLDFALAAAGALLIDYVASRAARAIR